MDNSYVLIEKPVIVTTCVVKKWGNSMIVRLPPKDVKHLELLNKTVRVEIYSKPSPVIHVRISPHPKHTDYENLKEV